MSYDPTTAKEMLLMAPSVEEQQFWVARLLKRIQKSGYKAAGHVSSPLSVPGSTLTVDLGYQSHQEDPGVWRKKGLPSGNRPLFLQKYYDSRGGHINV